MSQKLISDLLFNFLLSRGIFLSFRQPLVRRSISFCKMPKSHTVQPEESACGSPRNFEYIRAVRSRNLYRFSEKSRYLDDRPYDPVISTDFPRNPAIWMIHRPFDPVISSDFASNPAISMIHTRQIQILNVFTSESRFQFRAHLLFIGEGHIISHNFFFGLFDFLGS